MGDELDETEYWRDTCMLEREEQHRLRKRIEALEAKLQDTRPACIIALVEAGWTFEWHSEAQFIAAVHPLGGKQSIAHVLRVPRTGFDRDEIGEAMTKWINGGGS